MCALVTGVQTCALPIFPAIGHGYPRLSKARAARPRHRRRHKRRRRGRLRRSAPAPTARQTARERQAPAAATAPSGRAATTPKRSEEHTSELQSLMRNSYAVFCLKKKKHIDKKNTLKNSLHTITASRNNSLLTNTLP